MARRQSLRSILDVSAVEEEDAPSSIDLPNLWLRPPSPMAAPPRSHTEGSRAAGPDSEECGSEEQLGPGEIGQFLLHGCANCLPRAAHDPLIYGGERPHSCGSKMPQPHGRVVGNLDIQHDPASACGEGRGAAGYDFWALRYV